MANHACGLQLQLAETSVSGDIHRGNRMEASKNTNSNLLTFKNALPLTLPFNCLPVDEAQSCTGWLPLTQAWQ